MSRQWRWLFIGLLGLAVFWWGTRLWAEVTLEIFRAETEKIPIAVLPLQVEGAPGGAGQLVREVLLKDLYRSQVFRPIEMTNSRWVFPDVPTSEQVKLLAPEGVQGAVWGKLTRTPKNYRLDGYVHDVATATPILERRYIGQFQQEERQLRLMVHRFADEIVYRFTGERGIAQTRIAYVSDRTGFKEIHVMDYDGRHPRRITGDRSISLTPRWSPDGRFLAYVSYKGGQPRIYLHELVTARRVPLVDFSGMTISPAWSPKGDQMAFSASKDGNAEIYVADVSNLSRRIGQTAQGSTSERRLTFSRSEDLSPTWSPTGQQIAFTSDRGGTPQIYVMNADGSSVRRLTFEGPYNTSPAWSPRGDWIAYTCRREGILKICLVSPDGRTTLQVTQGGWDDESPAWAPNGRYLIFSSARRGKQQLCLITPAGADEEQLTFTVSNETAPGWSWN